MTIEVSLRELVREEVRAILPELLPRQDEWMSTAEVAKFTGLSATYFNVARSKGHKDQPVFHKIGRRVVYRKADVEEWLRARPKRGGMS